MASLTLLTSFDAGGRGRGAPGSPWRRKAEVGTYLERRRRPLLKPNHFRSPRRAAPDPRRRREAGWPQKSSLYILRTDGRTCSRELVSGAPADASAADARLPMWL